jgi:hypothetical protein
VSDGFPSPRDGDSGGPYRTEREAIARQHAIQRFGIVTGYRFKDGMWQLLCDPQGTLSDLNAERYGK